MKGANVHDERARCRKPAWADGGNRRHDDAARKADEARAGEKWLADGSSAC